MLQSNSKIYQNGFRSVSQRDPIYIPTLNSMQSVVSNDSLSKRSNAALDRDPSNPNHADISSAYQSSDIPASSDDKHEDKDNEDQTVSTYCRYTTCIMNLIRGPAG